jgi:hypothetical protein
MVIILILNYFIYLIDIKNYSAIIIFHFDFDQYFKNLNNPSFYFDFELYNSNFMILFKHLILKPK